MSRGEDGGDRWTASRSMEVGSGNVERLLRRESYKDEQAIKMGD